MYRLSSIVQTSICFGILPRGQSGLSASNTALVTIKPRHRPAEAQSWLRFPTTRVPVSVHRLCSSPHLFAVDGANASKDIRKAYFHGMQRPGSVVLGHAVTLARSGWAGREDEAGTDIRDNL